MKISSTKPAREQIPTVRSQRIPNRRSLEGIRETLPPDIKVQDEGLDETSGLGLPWNLQARL